MHSDVENMSISEHVHCLIYLWGLFAFSLYLYQHNLAIFLDDFQKKNQVLSKHRYFPFRLRVNEAPGKVFPSK